MTRFRIAEILTEQQLQAVDTGGLRILERVGMIVPHAEALGKLRAIRGVQVDGEIVRFEPQVVREAIAGIGGCSDYDTHEIAGCYAHNYLDPDTNQVRPPSVADLVLSIRQADALDMGVCGPVVPLADVTGPRQELIMERMTHEHSRFSYGAGQATNVVTAEASLEMSEAAGRPSSLELWINSPLKLDGDNLNCIWRLQHRRPSVRIANMPVRGMSGPIQLAALMAQTTAECFGAVTVLRLLDVSDRVSYRVDAIGMYSVDMQSANVLLSGPDYIKLWLLSVTMGKRHGIPTPAAKGLLTSAKKPDIQAAAEKAAGATAVALAGTGTYMCAGALSTVEVHSPVQMVIDREIMRYADSVAAPIGFSEDDLALDTIAEVGPGGTFLSHESTLIHFRDILWRPDLFSINAFYRWVAEGEPAIYERARDVLTSLKLREGPAVPPDVARELQRIEERFAARL